MLRNVSITLEPTDCIGFLNLNIIIQFSTVTYLHSTIANQSAGWTHSADEAAAQKTLRVGVGKKNLTAQFIHRVIEIFLSQLFGFTPLCCVAFVCGYMPQILVLSFSLVTLEFPIHNISKTRMSLEIFVAKFPYKLLFWTTVPTEQNGGENREKVY